MLGHRVKGTEVLWGGHRKFCEIVLHSLWITPSNWRDHSVSPADVVNTLWFKSKYW